MGCRGVHFALNEVQYKRVISARSDNELVDIIQEDIEEAWDEDWLHETDKAWDAIHRCLTDGKLSFDNGKSPLSTVVIGGNNLYKGDDYIISLVPPENVRSVAELLASIDKAKLKEGYELIDQSDYDGEIGEEDFEYTWEWFKGLPKLFSKAAEAGRAVIFTVDQ